MYSNNKFLGRGYHHFLSARGSKGVAATWSLGKFIKAKSP